MNKNSKSNTKGAELMPTPKSIPAAKLTGAAWNVHSKEKKTDEDFKGLVASIKSQGLIQRVAVRAMPNGEYQIIDGHRRTQAAVAAGLSDIPCDVYYDMKDADAQVRTVTANAQRTQSDPLLEAELYELLAKSGKTQKEVAAVVGQSERYVARRSRLIALIPEWRKTVKESGDVSSVSFLESLAAYSPELQREAHAAFEEGDIGDDEDDVIDWLKGRVMSLKDAPFCTKDCANCPFNTANNALLFAGMFDDENARCEKRTCFVGKWNAETDAQIEKLKASGTAVKEVKHKWDIPYSYDAKSQKDKKHTVPYVYEDWQLRTIVWAQPGKKSAQTTAAKPAQTSAEKKAAKEKRERHLAWFRARRSARDKANAALHATGVGNVFEKIVRECVGTPRFNEWVISYFAKYGPLHETWSSDDQNAALVGMAGDKLLKDFGLDFTEAELTAILSEDPDNAK